MKSRNHLSVGLWIALTLTVAAPKQAAAQDPGRVEVAGGYSFMRDYDGNATFPRGWFGSLALDLAGPIALAGEASGSYKSMGGLDVDLSVSSHTLMGGPRYTRRAYRVMPYAQMLFGLARTATTFDLPGERLAAARNNFAMAPGGGVDVRFSHRGAIRVGAAVRFIRSETSTPSGSEPFTFREFQFIAGLVFR